MVESNRINGSQYQENTEMWWNSQRLQPVCEHTCGFLTGGLQIGNKLVTQSVRMVAVSCRVWNMKKISVKLNSVNTFVGGDTVPLKSLGSVRSLKIHLFRKDTLN